MHVAADHVETLGCNDRVELAALRRLLRDRINEAWMRAGVTPARPRHHLDRRDGRRWTGTRSIDQNTQLRGGTVVGAGALIGPDVTLIDTIVGPAASVVRSHAVGAEVGRGRDRRAVRVPAAGRPAGREGEGRHVRRDEELARSAPARRCRT